MKMAWRKWPISFTTLIFHSIATIAVQFVDTQGDSIDLTFTASNQGEPLCTNVQAFDDQVLENEEFYTVTLTSIDRAVTLQDATTSLVVFDDDCECFS